MDVIAYSYGASDRVELGGIADSIWTNGFRFSQARTLQVSKPINAAAPNIFDRLTRVNDFSFAAGRSFKTVGEALLFFGAHPDAVPTVADLQFAQGGQQIWLRYCGIARVELVTKSGALVVFGYTVTGGTWSTTRS
jgi:hypothetical protein